MMEKALLVVRVTMLVGLASGTLEPISLPCLSRRPSRELRMSAHPVVKSSIVWRFRHGKAVNSWANGRKPICEWLRLLVVL